MRQAESNADKQSGNERKGKQAKRRACSSSSMLADKEHVTCRQAKQQSTISTQIN